MKIPLAFLLNFIFLELFHGSLSSDPDSVIAQSPEDNGEKSENMQREEGRPREYLSDEGLNGFFRTIMRPVRFGSKTRWIDLEEDDDYIVDENPQNVVTKSTERIPPDSNFFAGIVNYFAFKLIDTIDSNFVISPLSIFVALSMLYLGSDGNTKAQIEQALGMNTNEVHGENFHRGIQDLLSLVLKDHPSYKLYVANGMFLGQNFKVNSEFKENIKKYYDAELKNLDFRNSELSKREINNWVAEYTDGMIRNIINSEPHPLTHLMILNAVYFKGKWKTLFPTMLTYPGTFYSIDGKEKEILFMRMLDKTFPVYQSDEYKHTFIKLPYEDDQVSMIIALPYTNGQKPMPLITNEILCHIRDSMVNTEISTLALPKSRLKYKKSLIKALQALGIKDIFNANLADLNKIRKENDLYATAFIHKSVVEVNEVGTTASASTSISLTPLSGKMNSTDFIVDHPFAFYIVHEASGLMLFYGKVYDFDAVQNRK